jgi:GAF domain-containing protein
MSGWNMTEDRSSAEDFARLAVELHDVDGVEETVDAVVQFALQAVRCDFASVVLITGKRPEVMAVTHPALADLYQAQIEAKAGPLITTIELGQPVLISDVCTESRWSREWSERVLAAGIRTAIHLPMSAGNRPSAVLSLFRAEPDPFDDDDVAVAHILARHAAVAIASARKEANLTTAVDARKLIGQAMGILMERYNLDSDRAFEVLKRYSQSTNRKLRDVAQDLIDTRKLPAGNHHLNG